MLTRHWGHRNKSCSHAFAGEDREGSGVKEPCEQTWNCTSRGEREGRSRKRKECVSSIDDQIQFWEPGALSGQKREVGAQEMGLGM